MAMAKVDSEELLDHTWDVIVIGTGIGGATAGLSLAKGGQSVLFCERGQSYLSASNVLAGDWLDRLTRRDAPSPTCEHKRRAGRFSGQIVDITTGDPEPLQPMLGIGSGGSSALYGMAMERFFPSDFEPARYHRKAVGANLPEQWPISYDELAPYYKQAEELYGVRATVDPLRPEGEERGIVASPPFTEANEEIAGRFRDAGLHPYHLPMACEYVTGCHECIGFICDKRCKKDSVNACLEPALKEHGAAMLTECRVDALDAVDGRVSGVICFWQGRRVTLRAKTVIVAAGAVHTPAILLKSGGGAGLANRSGQVGRNLMRHFLDYFIVYPKAQNGDGLLKQIAFNDFYVVGDIKLGTVQSNGRLPPASSLAAGYRQRLRQKWSFLGTAFPLVRRIVEKRIELMLTNSHVLACFMEDLPYRDNRVTLSPDGNDILLNYHIPAYDRARLKHYRRLISSVLRPGRFKKILVAEENRILGHVCGTCRFGNDPETSVLDRNNRAHDVNNLYVVDASFLPSSGGTNPSLTIAANALRVADHILRLPDQDETVGG